MSDENDLAAMIEAMPDGWKSAMGMHFLRATPEQVIAELVIGPMHLQPLGIVHGGVHSGMIEAVASVGANLTLISQGKYAVGLENHTSFVHAVRSGTLRAVGKPLYSGNQSRLWEVDVHDAEGRVVATGRVRLHVIDAGSKLGGQKANLDPDV
jgi:1,4-dihydroxy-2-naphthoyl-CoA hydrolase